MKKIRKWKFNFDNHMMIGKMAKWVKAISDVPLMSEKNYAMFQYLIDAISEFYGEEFKDVPLEVNWFDQMDKTEHYFAVAIYPFDYEWELTVYFDRQNKAHIEDSYEYYQQLGLFEKIGAEEEKEISWQEAYKLICKVSCLEQEGVPDFIP